MRQSLIRGLRRVVRSPGLLLLAWCFSLSIAIPAGVLMTEEIRRDLGNSLVNEDLRSRLELGWLDEIHDRGGELTRALTPVRVSRFALFENADLWIDPGKFLGRRDLAAGFAMTLLLWIFFQGGAVARLAWPTRRWTIASFCGAGGEFLFRFLRIAILAGVGYWGILRASRWLFSGIERWTRDVTVESRVALLFLLAAAVVAFAMTTLHVIADQAKIVTVREQRRSMILALVAGTRRVLRHPVQLLGSYFALVLVLFACQWLHSLFSGPLPLGSPLALLVLLVIGQSYIVARWFLRLAFWGVQLELHEQWSGRSG